MSTGKQNGASMEPAPAAEEANTSDESEPPESHHEQLPSLPTEEELHSATKMGDEDKPPGFGIPHRSAAGASASPGINSDGGGADVPPGFEIVDADVGMPPGFSARVGGAVPAGWANGAGDDHDVPPGFG